MRKVWQLKAVNDRDLLRLAGDLSVSPLVARLLIHRGYPSAAQAVDFLCAGFDHLPPPQAMRDLERAVSLIRQTIRSKGKILVVGDYDVDGLTSTALLIRVLKGLGAHVSWHIPHRVNDGYGLKPEVVRKASSNHTKLLIAVDCGTTSFEELSLAKRLKIPTVVADHHELMGGRPPPASAFLNPLQPGCTYPNKDLASVGVAFTLLRGLAKVFPKISIWDDLDLVALGTVADLASVTGENRVLVKRGLHVLGGTRKAGLKALLSQTKLEGEILTSEDVSFMLAPRLNAMGRMGSPEASLQLLITEDAAEAKRLAKSMDEQNRARAAAEREAFRQALARVEREVNFRHDRVIVLEDERWHPGVVGIIATRLALQFHRPAVVIALDGELGRGSARSIGDFSLVEALEKVKGHLMEFGGHPGAAGLKVAREKISGFREALNRVAHQKIDPKSLTPRLELDAELPLSHLSHPLMRDLELLAPFGPGNPWPVFLAEDSRLTAKPTNLGYRGVRFLVESAHGDSFEATHPRVEGWYGWDLKRLPEGAVRLAYSPVRRMREDSLSIELKLRGLEPL
ncbi:MAG: single-stranded-DNA-specific exonuclease RecJ [Candidatus Omnitrophica bacterium]|nr:single-stranded-DNA-specific exonuclease RecJ [Candidatus Omnitrophota bacterium]